MYNPKKLLKNGLCAVSVVFASSFMASFTHAEQIGMESATPNSLLGMFPQAMAPYWSKQGVDIQLSLNQTLTKSLLKIGQGSLDSAVIPPLAFTAMQKGVGPYAKMADKAKALSENVRGLFTLPGSYYHAITRADSGINTWADARGKRVYIGPPAGAANSQIISLAAAGGLAEGDYEAIKAPWGAAAQSYQDGQFDVFVGTFSLGSQSLAELSLSNDIRLLGVPGEKMIPPKGLGMQAAEIPANTYPGQVNTTSVLTWQTIMMMAVKKDLSDDIAYTLTKQFVENRLALAKSNSLFNDLLTTDYFVGVNAPLHPGAVRYYREAGIAIPEELLPPQS
ncbi:TAXI family TRAP transporter solute-binding subunit [Marinomonas sp. BSi20584]|uniref:TAXI family TRAP transporter solute-binding subunit n=1 Tax=Marinomonas sp. BSi20584 TaxID=1594462 RepID=UPI000C1E1091|nr:TAXI family TRAP transporter solute-binding subunit [Marinomonas sp. BSi20584]PJE53218.1 TRAP transporter solute receptor, TAXI family protein [Marinomonas sp. BSi20584]